MMYNNFSHTCFHSASFQYRLESLILKNKKRLLKYEIKDNMIHISFLHKQLNKLKRIISGFYLFTDISE